MYLFKAYHKDKHGRDIKFTISFNRDTRNWATGQPKKIGYQVTATPVKRTKLDGGFSMEEFTAFSGFNDCLLECERQSKNRLTQAINILGERLENYMKFFDEQNPTTI